MSITGIARFICLITGMFLVLLSLSVVLASYSVPALIGLVAGVGLCLIAAK